MVDVSLAHDGSQLTAAAQLQYITVCVIPLGYLQADVLCCPRICYSHAHHEECAVANYERDSPTPTQAIGTR